MMRFACLLGCLWASSLTAESYPEAVRVVTVGGTVTEIVYALGEQDRIVARDTTSIYPTEANDLPDVGYMRRLSAEGVLSVGPDLIIARSTSGPPEALDQLKSASVPIEFVQDDFTAASVVSAIETVGTVLGVSDKSDALAAQVQAELDMLAVKVAALPSKKKVLFVLSLDGGRLNAAGTGTGASGIIALAGGENIMDADFPGYKLVDAEAVVAANPDVIVMMQGRGDHAVKIQDILALPAIQLTTAGREGNFVFVPGATLGFGPRTGALGLALFEQLYGRGS